MSDHAARPPRIPTNWRELLPNAESYYRQHVAKLTTAKVRGWAQGLCPFHDDHEASLSVQLVEEHGGWRCFAGCGSGDLVSFHMKLTGQRFVDAVLDLVGGGA